MKNQSREKLFFSARQHVCHEARAPTFCVSLLVAEQGWRLKLAEDLCFSFFFNVSQVSQSSKFFSSQIYQRRWWRVFHSFWLLWWCKMLQFDLFFKDYSFWIKKKKKLLFYLWDFVFCFFCLSERGFFFLNSYTLKFYLLFEVIVNWLV